MVTPSIFRAYDIRGIVDKELNTHTMQSIGKAFGTQAHLQQIPCITLGRDGRLSSLELAQAFAKGVQQTGVSVIDIGCIPTPALYFAAHEHTHASGAMITGSHNPANYNGVKLLLNHTPLANEAIQTLYRSIQEKKLHTANTTGTYRAQCIKQNYIQTIQQSVSIHKPLTIVVDAGNGAAGPLAVELYRSLGMNVIELYTEIDGTFPNHHPDPSIVDNLNDLKQAVLTHNADVGLAFDGDGDRLGVISNTTDIIWPDRLLMLYAKSILKTQANQPILYDVKCTSHLKKIIEQYQGIPIMSKTGHSLIKQHMKKKQAILAGEMSGHFFFKHRWYGFDDGLYAGARLLEILSQSSDDLQTIMNGFPNSINTPEIKIPIPEEEKQQFITRLIQKAKFTSSDYITLDGLRVEYPYGWGLIRASNTSPNLILRFEATNSVQLHRIIKEFNENILAINPTLILPHIVKNITVS